MQTLAGQSRERLRISADESVELIRVKWRTDKREASGPAIRQELPRLTSKYTAMDRRHNSARMEARMSIGGRAHVGTSGEAESSR